jgi:hypothetical protein
VLILEFESELEAKQALNIIEDRSMNLFEQHGYFVDRERRKVFTDSNPKAYIDKWDDVRQNESGKFYFISPRIKYPHLFDIMTEGLTFNEIDYVSPDEESEE